MDSALPDYLAKMEAFLQAHYPECVLMPTRNNHPGCSPNDASGKNPIASHKNIPTAALWNQWHATWRQQCSNGLLIILRTRCP